MNPYSFALLLFAFGSFFIGLLIWFKRADSVGLVYFIFSGLTFLWAVGFSIMLSENISYETALLCARIADSAALFIPATWMNLALLITGDLKRHRNLLIFLYLISFTILLFASTPLFISGAKPIMGFKYWLKPGPIFHIFTFIFSFFVPYGFVFLIKKTKNASSEEKTQLKGFVIATMIGFIGGGITFLPNYDIAIPQYNIFLMPVYPFITAYFLIKHRLFDLEAVIQLFQREKLATLGLLAASVNHEIRNPLYVAKTTLESFIEKGVESDPSKSLESSKKTLAAVNRALEVITKLNRFAKPSIDSTSLDQSASIPEALQTVLDLISYEFKSDKIKIMNQIPDHLSQIMADQRQLEEILFNLIVNACHAMENGGELVVASEAKQSKIDALGHPRKFLSGIHDLDSRLKRAGMTSIIIQDTGHGIPQDQMKHLFEPFHTTKGDKGTGLGLYITKQLVERNGGKISVSSKPNQGTLFRLEFKTVA